MSLLPFIWLFLPNVVRSILENSVENGVVSTPKPNIILFIADDQDSLLGSMEFMPKTLKFMRKRGAEFENAFVSTPMCCPSRTSILTGLYAHNHNVMTNNLNCAGAEWRDKFEKETFAVYLRDVGYQTAYFGKYLNEYDGSYVPPGWDEWAGLIRNSRFYNYTVNRNNVKEKHGFDYYDDYFTDLVTNSTTDFLEKRILQEQTKPFLIVVSYPAPHGPEDPAPQYAKMFENVDTHRTAAWNYAPNPDKQWILQRTGKMESTHVFFTDLLHRRRLQTLQSVDDSVQRIMNFLRATNQLQNTFTMYTSDHGYHLGQFGLIKGKSMPYEFDIKVPFFIRGPGIHKGIIKREPILNIDIAPTILHIAGIDIPEKMNGESILKAFEAEFKWRQTVLIERGKMPRLKKVGERFRKQKEHFNKYLIISRQCSKAKYSAPCKARQDWACVKNPLNRWRIIKCRQREDDEKCQCRGKRDIPVFGEDSKDQLDRWEDEFLAESFDEILAESGEWFQGTLQVDDEARNRMKREINEIRLEVVDEHVDENSGQEDKLCAFKSKKWCSLPANITRRQWDRRKYRVDLKIQKLKDRILAIKDIRKALRQSKPEEDSKGMSDVNAEEKCDCEQTRMKHRFKNPFFAANNRTLKNCTLPQMNCFEHSDSHWKTEPKWPSELGSFCFCQNSNNNTYWCLRTVNETHNFLYCEFVTGFLSFYDFNVDPNQLTNAIFELENHRLSQLNDQLLNLKSCSNQEECENYSAADWDQRIKPLESPNPSNNSEMKSV
ncbi:unnamed protein product [Bursaphelenchus xylophilus]|uniref:(pine wood nematode) hypothetical protein n=1 Tax=Bursaphelenchus xylophilus TaxID=6326 RepID=A0A1I7S0M9_BURXY|nr:unnamed protein product [Bursaphelenchus xylophilus]CAG9132360.1 unnamed protein product [Bursaphelenchus xylophilus]